MIDIESEIFSRVSHALREQFTPISIVGEEIRSPAGFPCVSIVETDNTSFLPTQDSAPQENHATLLYEINVYSNQRDGKKTQCRTIYGAADRVLLQLGFLRIFTTPITMLDATVYRMIGRYRAVVSKDKIMYRR